MMNNYHNYSEGKLLNEARTTMFIRKYIFAICQSIYSPVPSNVKKFKYTSSYSKELSFIAEDGRIIEIFPLLNLLRNQLQLLWVIILILSIFVILIVVTITDIIVDIK